MSTATTTRTIDGIAMPAAGRYTIDSSHTQVEFAARHLMLSKVRGRFADVAGTVVIGEDPLASSVEITIPVATLTTGDARRDEHLRSSDFFAVEAHPEARFVSTAVRPDGPRRFLVDGDLTIRGTTAPVTLALELTGTGPDPWGTERFGIEASAELDRADWGLNWNQTLETGGVLVSKSIQLQIAAQATQEA